MFKTLKYIFFLLFIFFNGCLSDTECPNVVSIEDRRENKNRIRIAQYNVEWLFIDYYSPMNCPGDGCTWKNQSEALTHLNYVVKRIKDINPDIINFCEIEGCDELNMVKQYLDDGYNAYLKKGTDTSTGQNVGMLTRIDPTISLFRSEDKFSYPIAESNCGYTGTGGTTGVSKHFITEFVLDGINIAFISAHLLAIPTDSNRCAQREAQASILQNIIYGYISKNYEVIMLGDFNDYDAEVMDVNDNKPISHVLGILKGLNGELAGKYQLLTVSENIEKTQRYSDWWDSDNNCDTSSSQDYSLIDHILVTEFIQKKILDVFIYHGYDEFCGKYDSDHYPIVIDLQI
jgi:exonuclease III